METELEMVFKTGAGKKFRIAFDNPRTDVAPAEIQAAMDLVIGKNLFAVDGGVTAIESAQTVTTQTEAVEFA